MTKSMMAMTWLTDYATLYGEKLPNTTKALMYESMVAETDMESDPVSLSHFLRLWRDEAAHIAIPKVYIVTYTCIVFVNDCLREYVRLFTNKFISSI